MSRNKLETKNFLTVSFQGAGPPLVGAADISANADTSALMVAGGHLLMQRAVGEIYHRELVRQPL